MANRIKLFGVFELGVVDFTQYNVDCLDKNPNSHKRYLSEVNNRKRCHQLIEFVLLVRYWCAITMRCHMMFVYVVFYLTKCVYASWANMLIKSCHPFLIKSSTRRRWWTILLDPNSCIPQGKHSIKGQTILIFYMESHPEGNTKRILKVTNVVHY